MAANILSLNVSNSLLAAGLMLGRDLARLVVMLDTMALGTWPIEDNKLLKWEGAGEGDTADGFTVTACLLS